MYVQDEVLYIYIYIYMCICIDRRFCLLIFPSDSQNQKPNNPSMAHHSGTYRLDLYIRTRAKAITITILQVYI